MSYCTAVENIKAAKKAHRCSWCGERIEQGKSYLRYRYFDGGDAGTTKMHPECEAAFDTLDSVDKQEGFYPGENVRGCTCGGWSGCDTCKQVKAKVASGEY